MTPYTSFMTRPGAFPMRSPIAGLARQSLPSRRCEPIVLGAAAERRRVLVSPVNTKGLAQPVIRRRV